LSDPTSTTTTKPRTGSAWKGAAGRWRIQATLRNGKRTKQVTLPEGTSEARARDRARHLAKLVANGGERAEHVAATRAAETVSQYAERWLADREARGIASLRDDRQRFRSHVEPVLGSLAVANVSRDDIRRLVVALDRDDAVRFSSKTARHVWVLVRSLFKDAYSAKRGELVVRDTDPTAGVRPPDRGEDRDRTYLYPSEFASLVACDAVPLERRRLYALAAYTLSRAGELRVLR
jgi:hypothetical protein